MTGRIEKVIAFCFIAVVLTFLFLPTVVVVVFAFEPSRRIALPLTGFSLKWFANIFVSPDFSEALHNSAIAAVLTAAIATPLGTTAAVGLQHLQPAARQRGSLGLMLPAVVPGLLLGIALIILFRIAGIESGLDTIIVGHALVGMPFVVLTVHAQLELFDRSILDAARDLGASSVRAAFDITWPLVRSAIVSSAFLAAALSLDEFVITFFVNGGEITAPLLIWGKMRLGIDPTVNALATLFLATTVLLSVLSTRLTRVRV